MFLNLWGETESGYFDNEPVNQVTSANVMQNASCPTVSNSIARYLFYKFYVQY